MLDRRTQILKGSFQVFQQIGSYYIKKNTHSLTCVLFRSFLRAKCIGTSISFSLVLPYYRLSEKFLSFYKEIINAQCFLFYISLLNYART